MTNQQIAVYMMAGAILLSLRATPATAQRYVEGEEPGFPVVQYTDSLYSLNDRCIVRLRKLSLRMPATYVNGLPIGFC